MQSVIGVFEMTILKRLKHFIPWRFLLLIFILSGATLWLYTLVAIAPSFHNEEFDSNNSSSDATNLRFPSNIEQLQQLSNLLKQYNVVNAPYVFVLFASAYLYKQTFAIPGSVFMNLLAGALYGIWLGFPLCCLLTATGASCCYLLSNYCGKSVLIKYFPHRIKSFKDKIYENRSKLIYILLFLRLFPMTPNWFLNMASPVVGIPLPLFFLSVFIGLMPYNFICVQTGCLLSQLKSINDIISLGTMLKLALIAIVALLPSLIFRRQKKLAKN